MTKPERTKYDPAQPMSFCQTCLKLDWTRKRNGKWLCSRCTRAAMDREKILADATRESLNRPPLTDSA